MEDQPTLPQATTLTPKSDVRTLDKQSDPEKTPMPTEKKHCRGWLIPITINQISTLALFQVWDRQVRCVPEPARVVKAGLKIVQLVELPARPEVIVPCKPTHASSWLQRTTAVAQPWSNQWRYAEDGIVIGSALKTPDQLETVIPVMNLTDEPRTLYRGTRIGEAHVITQCDRVEGILPMSTQDSEDSKESDDEGWLRDGRIQYQPNATLWGRAAFSPA